jgi:hypothetical protein
MKSKEELRELDVIVDALDASIAQMEEEML